MEVTDYENIIGFVICLLLICGFTIAVNIMCKDVKRCRKHNRKQDPEPIVRSKGFNEAMRMLTKSQIPKILNIKTCSDKKMISILDGYLRSKLRDKYNNYGCYNDITNDEKDLIFDINRIKHFKS